MFTTTLKRDVTLPLKFSYPFKSLLFYQSFPFTESERWRSKSTIEATGAPYHLKNI